MSRVRSQLDNLLQTPHSPAETRHGVIDGNVETVERRLEAEWAAELGKGSPRNAAPQPAGSRAPQRTSREGRASRQDNPQAEANDLARIRASLDRLASRLNTVGGQAAQNSQGQSLRQPRPQSGMQAGVQTGAQTRSKAPARRAGSGGEADSFAAIGREIRDELNALRSDLGEAFSTLERGGDPQLHEDVRMLAESVAGLERRVTQPPASSGGMADEIAAELHNLRLAVQDIANHTVSGPDYGGLSQSIESGYAELAGRMEQMISSLMSQTAGADEDHVLRNELAMLSDHVSSIRQSIDGLPDQSSTAVIENRLDQLSRSIEELADADEHSLARHFSEVDARLDEITRALVAVSSSSGGPGDKDALERIEARINTLAKTVEQTAEQRRQSGALPAGVTDDFAGEVKSALEAIDHRLAELGQAPIGGSPDLDTIATRLATLSDKLDNIPGLNAAAAQMTSDGTLFDRLDAIVDRLDGLGDPAMVSSSEGKAALGAIEQQLADLAGRIDKIAVPQSFEFPEAEQFAALEKQLGGIVSQLDTISASGFDLAPISERLDSIEQQVANSRDIAIDVASQAAERAIGLSGDGPAIDPQAIEALRSELRDLDVNSRDIGQRNAAAFETVHEALSVIVDRLGEIDTRMRDLTGAERGHESDRGADRYGAGEFAASRSAPPLGGTNDEMREFEDPNTGEDYRLTDHADASAADSGPAYGGHELHEDEYEAETLPPIDRAPPLDMDELPPQDTYGDTHREDREDVPEEMHEEEMHEEVEDVPLEPGSGTPDFAALVRQAAAKRHSGGSDEPQPAVASDLISAARRAAQAATQESAAEKPKKPARGKSKAATKDKGGKAKEDKVKGDKASGGTSWLRGKARTLILTAALIAAILVTVPYIMRFLGQSDAPVESSEATGSSVEQPMIAPAEEKSAESQTMAPARDDRPSMAASNGSSMQAAPAPVTPVDRQARVSPVTVAPEEATPANSVNAAMETSPAEPMTPVANTAKVEIPEPPVETGNVALRQAAKAGDGQALFEIARRYTDGDGVDRDLTKAAKWYELSAETGFAPAQYRIGNFLEKGHGGETDVDKAAEWYKRAAEQGNALAMHNLAVLHTSGLVGGKPDMTAAVEWFRKAGELGVKDSQVNLGILYTRGMGVKEDLVEAYKWFAIAARAGDSDAASKRDMLAGAMRPDQLEKARGMAELWRPTIINAAANSVSLKPEWTEKPQEAAAAPDSRSAGTAGASNGITGSTASSQQMIERVQTLLARLGFDAGPSDGIMGAKTRDAIKAYQRSAGMEADGQVTSRLVKALEDSAV